MEEYKCQMGIQMKCQNLENLDDRILRHQSVTCISLVKDEREAGETPCWLVVINLCALRAITDPSGKYCILHYSTSQKCVTEVLYFSTFLFNLMIDMCYFQ